LIWSSTAPLAGSAWNTTHAFFGGLTYYDGLLLAPTYNFVGTSELVAVDAWTGELVWINNATVSGNSTPIAMDGGVYLVGPDTWGDPSYLARYSLDDGSELLKQQLTADSTMWNVSPVAYNDAIALTLGSDSLFPGADTGLRLIDPFTGADLVSVTLDSEAARGTPAIGKDGRLYLNREAGGLSAYIPVAFDNAVLADLSGNFGAGQTDDRNIEITIDAPFATEIRIAEATPVGDISASPWVPFASPTTFEVSPGSGMKFVDLQVRNGSTESAVQQFSIEYFEPSFVNDWQVLND
jgi:outer membrane protein assembly factor BamB